MMNRRAERIFQRVRPHLPAAGKVADLGSGTGHNGEFITSRTNLTVHPFDVEDIHWIGPSPEILSNGEIPVDDGYFDAVLLMYVLHYPADAAELLREASRIAKGPLIVLQSTYAGGAARAALRAREFLYGRFGFYLSRAAGLVAAESCPLTPTRYFTREELASVFSAAGLVVRATESLFTFRSLRRDLFVLERGRA